MPRLPGYHGEKRDYSKPKPRDTSPTPHLFKPNVKLDTSQVRGLGDQPSLPKMHNPGGTPKAKAVRSSLPNPVNPGGTPGTPAGPSYQPPYPKLGDFRPKRKRRK